jgi:LysR family nitrogen assimilation transcriptional regulator
VDLRLLRYFVATCELGSISAAARYLQIAQPALSRQITMLEATLETPLLMRSARGVKMTEAGERLFRHALEILYQLERVPQVVGGRAHAVSGRVSVGLPTSVSALLSAPLVRTTAARYPEIRLHLLETLSGHLGDWVQAGRVDVAILFDVEAAPNMRIDPLLVEDLCLVGAPSAFPPGMDVVPFAQLPDYPLVLPAEPHSIRRLLDRMGRSHGVALRIDVEIDSLNVNKELARGGDLFAVLAEGAVRHEQSAGTLRALKIVAPTVSRSVSLAASTLPGRSSACEYVRLLILELVAGLIGAQVWRTSGGSNRTQHGHKSLQAPAGSAHPNNS